MKIVETELRDVFEILPERVEDQRGFFVRVYCAQELSAAGIDFRPEQASLSHNVAVHTLRGMHYQVSPNAEAKLVQVTNGAIHDVVVDIRPDSPTFLRWISRELTAANGVGLYIPIGCAHGFLTLDAETDVLYHIDRAHVPGAGSGFRFDDPAFGIRWPAEPRVLSAADRGWARWPAIETD